MERTTFNWETAHGSPERVAWLKANHDKPITEEQYLEAVRGFPHNHKHPSNCKTPSKNKRDYKYLKDRFGFFGGSDE